MSSVQAATLTISGLNTLLFSFLLFYILSFYFFTQNSLTAESDTEEATISDHSSTHARTPQFIHSPSLTDAFFKKIYFCFLAMLSGMWDLSSLTGIKLASSAFGSTESQPLDLPGDPHWCF